MRLWWAGCAVAVGLAGCQSAPVPAGEIVVSGSRAQLRDSLKSTPYPASGDEMCAIATAVVTEKLRDNADGPPDPVLWQDEKRSNVDCTTSFAPAGLPLADTSLAKKGVRVFMPRQLRDGRIAVSTTYFCEGWCGASGATYIVHRQGEGWSVDPQPVLSWIQ